MRVFGVDPKLYANRFSRNGYVYIPFALTDEMALSIMDFYRDIEAGSGPDVYRYDFTDEQLDEIRTFYGVVAGIGNELTISRNYLNIYHEIETHPHKDRLSLAYNMGLGLLSGPNSRVMLWPEASLEENTGENYGDYVRRVGGQDKITEELSKSAPISLALDLGDVVLFPGNRMYHHRLNPAGTVIYYFSFNETGMADRGPNRFERSQAA